MSFEITVNNTPIRLLIDQIVQGHIALPSFQRDFVWESRHVRDLYDSIYNEFPIGVLILWEPSEEYIKGLNYEDDYIFFHDDINQHGKLPKYLVLDGHQRLTSLILPLYDWTIKRVGRIVADLKEERIFFNPKTEGGEFIVGKSIGIDLKEIYQAYYLYDTMVIMKLGKEVSDDDRKKLEQLAKKIFEYRVPVYIYKSRDESPDIYIKLAESFVRINKSGVKIGNVDLMSSLILSYQPDLNQSISNTFNRIKNNIRVDNKGLIIRLLLKYIGLKQTDIMRIPLRELKSLEKRIEIAKKQGKFEDIKNFLENDVAGAFIEVQNIFIDMDLIDGNNLRLGDLIPSQISLLPVVYYIIKLKSMNKRLTNNDKIAIISWLILTSIRKRYVSNIETKLEKDLEEIDAVISNNHSFETFLTSKISKLEKIKFKEVKEALITRRDDPWIFALHVLLSKRKADDWTGIKLSVQNITNIAVHHIFPKSLLKDKKINSIGNITLINKSINRTLSDKQPSEYLEQYANLLDAHFIPSDKELWKMESFDKFIEERTRMLYNAWKKEFPLIFD